MMERMKQWLGISRESSPTRSPPGSPASHAPVSHVTRPSNVSPSKPRSIDQSEVKKAEMATSSSLPAPARRRSRSKSPSRPGRQRQTSSGSRTLGLTKTSDDETFLPRAHQNPEVQESDGNFFESFTALAWRQENKRLRLASEDEKEAEKPPPSETKFGAKPKHHQLSRKEYELLYIEVLYTIKHKIGTTTSCHSPFIQDLYQYAQEAFGVRPEDHARLLAKATEEKPPIVILNISVIEAKGLLAKDADGFSDPYCMLGIQPSHPSEGDPNTLFSSDEESGTRTKEKERRGLRKFSTSLRKKKDKELVKDLVPAKYIQTTAVIPNTLNPEWNEKFRFDLDAAHTDRFHLDIWDHDEEFSVIDAAKSLNEVSGFRGLGRFFKQIAQSARTKNDSSIDDFLGCVDIGLDNIPSVGLDQWYQLQGRSSRSNIQGEIHLKLKLATREDRGIPEDDNWTDVKQHEDLMCIFIEHEVRKFNDPSFKWTGDLPQAALTILHQHAIQGDVTEVQQAVCRWMAHSRQHAKYPLSYSLLLAHLTNLDKVWKPATLSRDEEESLAESFNLFIEYCLTLLHRQRETFPPSNRTAFSRLEGMFRCLANIYSMKVFKKCCPFQKELHSEITAVVKRGNQDWYERLYSSCRSQTKREEDSLQSLIELTNHLNADIYRGSQYYNSIFESLVSVNYFSLTYRQLEKMLGEEVNQDISVILKKMDCDRELDSLGPPPPTMGTTLFELYLALQEFARYSNNLPPGELRSLAISQYYEWFGFAVSKWLCIARHKALKRIRKAVELDKVAQVDAVVKYSTSAVDVCCCFAQITEFWKQLSWPDLVGAYQFVHRLVEDISNGAQLYADLVHEKLTAAGYYDDEGQFDITEQLCITINNIEQVRRSLCVLPESLEFNAIQRALEATGGDGAEQLDAHSLRKKLCQADSAMIRKITQVVDRVADKMRPDIKKDVFHLNWAPESLPADDAVGDLLEYLDSNLLTLNNNLLKTNFDRILESIWVEVLEEFKDVLDNEEVRPPIFYQRMFDALGLLVDFFHAKGKGLNMEDILSQQFQELRELLTFHKMDTTSLIETFYIQMAEIQKQQESTEFGVLNFRAVYRYDSHTLYVEVLSAKDLIPLDANGLSDPFVLVQLCPDHVFPDITVQSTQVVKKTLHPLFEESFEFAVNPGQCQHKGATLLFTVMDHDLVFQNDFAGEVYLAMEDVPGVSGEEVKGYDALSIISLPLIQPKHKAYGALQILAQRVWDKEAQEFVKKRSKVEEQAA
ncbi:BAI1-associated protein 3-like isoform X2 [Haliotis rufescens]|uniref:BAI1-associated protein 3-like isoform X2 n=1 Tax=Haliotis rufescens TaxID=6454 RepID=UPI00201EB143|nr:BAI1-associated protein 3-like isoform X2 [Haliotis rufescens]